MEGWCSIDVVSTEAGVTFPTERRREPHHADPFIMFNVWFAGLLTDALEHIDGESASYRLFCSLRASRQSLGHGEGLLGGVSC
jgi:hypothetical protein